MGAAKKPDFFRIHMLKALNCLKACESIVDFSKGKFDFTPTAVFTAVCRDCDCPAGFRKSPQAKIVMVGNTTDTAMTANNRATRRRWEINRVNGVG